MYSAYKRKQNKLIEVYATSSILASHQIMQQSLKTYTKNTSKQDTKFHKIYGTLTKPHT